MSRLLSVVLPAVGAVPAERSRPFDARHSGLRAKAGQPADEVLQGSIKFCDAARGFGFVVPDDGGPSVFVHCSVVFRAGLAGQDTWQPVLVRDESVPPGLQATGIEPL